MESGFHGAPISATQAAASFTGIRAPLTVDESDFEYSASSKGRRNSTTSSYYSGSELESEGFESGEDERESVSGRPLVVEKDGGILEETHFVEENAFSEAIVKIPDENFVQESSSVDGNVVLRPVAEIPDKNSYKGRNIFDEILAQESGNVSGNDVLRPVVRIPDKQINKGSSNYDDSDDSESFLSDSGDELVKKEFVVKDSDSRPLVSVKDGEVSENGLLPLVDRRVSLVQKLHIPIAQISADSDEDSHGSEVSDEEGFSGIARIPSIEVLRRVDSALKVRISESDEADDDEESLDEYGEDLVVSNVVSDEKEHFDVLADMVQDKGSDMDKDSMNNSLFVNEEVDSTLESGQNGDFMHIDEGIQEIDEQKCVESVDNGELNSTSESGHNGDVMDLDWEIQEIDVVDEQRQFVERVDDEELRSTSESGQNGYVMHLDEEIQEIDVIVEQEKYEESVNKELNSTSESGQNEYSTLSDEENQEIDVFDEQKKCAESIDRELNSTSESGQNGDSIHLDEENQETDVIIEQKKCVESVDTKILDSTSESEQNEDTMHLVDEMQEADAIDEKQCVEFDDCREYTDFSEDVIFPQKNYDHSTRSERVESEGEHEISPIHRCVDIKEVPGEGYGEFPLTVRLTESVSVYTSDSLSRDAGEFVSDGSVLDQETKKEDENSGRLSERISDKFELPATNGELEEAISESDRKRREKIKQIRAKYLHLIRKLGCSPEDSVASKVLYQLTRAEKRSTSSAIHLDRTKDELDFSLSILVIGKTGVGKSATINSIFGEKKAVIDAFEPSTDHVREITGTVAGVKLKVFDTPGFRPCSSDLSINRKILLSIKKLIQISPPDIILYVDRLDTQKSLYDLPLLKSLTSYLGSSIWRKSIIAFTHGNSLPLDGPHGYPLNYEAFVSQQSQIIQQLIGHPMIPVCVVENLETMSGNEESWSSNLLLLSYSLKMLSELSSMVRIDNPLNHGVATMSTLLQSSPHPNQSNDNDIVSDNALCYLSDSDMALPPSIVDDSPCFRYRLLQPLSQFLTRPAFDSPWDYDSLSITFVEENVVKGRLGKQSIMVRKAGSIRLSVGRSSRFSASIALDSKQTGQISIRTGCSDHLQIAAMAFVPVARAVFKKIFRQSIDD